MVRTRSLAASWRRHRRQASAFEGHGLHSRSGKAETQYDMDWTGQSWIATSAQSGEPRASAYGVWKCRCEPADEVNQTGPSSMRAGKSIKQLNLSMAGRAGVGGGNVSWRAGTQVMRAGGCGSSAECGWESSGRGGGDSFISPTKPCHAGSRRGWGLGRGEWVERLTDGRRIGGQQQQAPFSEGLDRYFEQRMHGGEESSSSLLQHSHTPKPTPARLADGQTTGPAIIHPRWWRWTR